MKTSRLAILDFIRSYTAEHGYSPSYREIGEAVGLRSTQSVSYHMDILVAEKKITVPYRNGRMLSGLMVVEEIP